MLSADINVTPQDASGHTAILDECDVAFTSTSEPETTETFQEPISATISDSDSKRDSDCEATSTHSLTDDPNIGPSDCIKSHESLGLSSPTPFQNTKSSSLPQAPAKQIQHPFVSWTQTSTTPPESDTSTSTLDTSAKFFGSAPVAPLSAYQIVENAHQLWSVHVILVLVLFLHTQHHVSFKACSLLLVTLNTILTALGLISSPGDVLPVTLSTIFHCFYLEDRFTIFPVCHVCHQLFPLNISPDTCCTQCDLSLFPPFSPGLPRPAPHLAAPIQVLSSLLGDFLSCEGNENALDEWWTIPESTNGKLHSIHDGNVWKTIPGPDGQPFLHHHLVMVSYR